MAKVNQIQDKNGNVRDIVDKALDAKSTVTTLSSTDEIVAKTTGGAYEGITPANLASVLGVYKGSFTLAGGAQKTLSSLGLTQKLTILDIGGAVCFFASSNYYICGFNESGGYFANSITNDKICIMGDASGAYIINKKSSSQTINYHAI